MAHRWVKWALFGSSYSPLFLILLFRDLETAGGIRFRSPGLSWTLLGIVTVSNAALLAVLAVSKRFAPQAGGVVTTVSSKTGETLNYIVTYIIPFLSLEPAKDLVPLIILMLVVGVLYVNSNLLYINPMLSFAGFGVYEVTLNGKGPPRIVLTRRPPKVDDPINIASISRGIGADVIYREV